MTGIVNSTGAKSGIIGTTVGTPASASHVLQTISYKYSTTTGVSGWQSIGQTQSITPSSTSNEILITWTFILGIANNTAVTSGNFGGGFRIRRTAPDTATVYQAATQSTYFYLQSYTSGNMQHSGQYGGSALDSPATLSTVTYTPEATNAVSGTANANYGASDTFIILQEIAR